MLALTVVRKVPLCGCMPDMDITTPQQLREEINKHKATHKACSGYPKDLRYRMAACAHECRRQGRSVWKLAKMLGIGVSTMQKLLKEPLGEATLIEAIVPVRVINQEIPPEPTKGHIVVRGYHGVVVEGLCVAELAELLRALS